MSGGGYRIIAADVAPPTRPPNGYRGERALVPARKRLPPPPLPDPEFAHLGAALTVWVAFTVSFEVGCALYGFEHEQENIARVYQKLGRPSQAKYRAMLEEEAARSGVPFSEVMRAPRGGRKAAHVRFRVWAKLRAEGYSLPGIGETAGKDHTSILHGIRKLKASENESPKLG